MAIPRVDKRLSELRTHARKLAYVDALRQVDLQLAGVFRLADDVDLPTGELRGKPRVLATAADRQRQLVVRHDGLHGMLGIVDDCSRDLRRIQRPAHEHGGIGAERDDVDLLARELTHDRLDPRTLDADAGAHGIDTFVMRDDRNLGPAARLARDRHDLHDRVVDLRDLHAEELLQEVRMRP